MKKLLIVSLLALASAITASAQNATASFVYTPNPVNTGAPGSTITFRIDMVFTLGTSTVNGNQMNDVSGLSYWFLQLSGPNGNTVFPFAVTNRDFSISPFQVAQTNFGPPINDAQYPQPFNASPNQADLGALGGAQTTSPIPIANITLSIAANAVPGTYTIANSTTGGKQSIFTDVDGDASAISQSVLTITVVPEPSTYALLGLAGIGFAVVAYRRRAMAS